MLERRLCLCFRLRVGLRRDAGVQIYLGGRVHAQVLIHTGSGLHELHIFLTKLAVEGLANMLPLDFSEHAEIVLVDFLDLNLLVVLVCLLQILELDVRHVVLFQVNSYYALRQLGIHGLNAVAAACEQERCQQHPPSTPA